MAVVIRYGKGIKDPAVNSIPRPVHAEAEVRALISKVAILATDDVLSKQYFGKLPSHAIISPRSTLHHGVLTGCSDYDIGLEKEDGTVVDADILLDGADIVLAGTKSLSPAIGNLDKRVWELLGLAADPGLTYNVVGICKAEPTAGADVAIELYWLRG